MRKLIVGVALLALVVMLVTAAALVSFNRIIAMQRGAILERVQQELGRPVRAADIKVQLYGGPGVGLSAIEIGEDPAFGEEPFVRAEELTAFLGLMALLGGRVEVARVTVVAPVVRLIRDARGRWNYGTLGPLGPGPRTAVAARLGGTATVSEPDVAAMGFALVVRSARLTRGTLVFVDRDETHESTVTARHVDLRLRDLGWHEPIGFAVSAEVDSDDTNVLLDGAIGPVATSSALPIQARGRLGPFTGMTAVIDSLDLQASISGMAVEVQRLNGDALDGSFALTGSYALTSGGPVRLKGEVRDISLPKLIKLRSEGLSQPVEGRGSLRLDVRGETGQSLLRSLAGMVAVEVADGSLPEFNLVRELLDQVSGVPGLAELVSERIRPKYRRLFETDDTRFRESHATLRLVGGRAETDDLTLSAEHFGLHAQGWLDFDRSIDMLGTLAMSRDFSDDLVADVKEAKYLVDDNGQLTVPFRLQGKLGRARPKPDAAFLASIIERALRRGAAGKLLDKLLSDERAGQPRKSQDPWSAVKRGLDDLLRR